MLFTDLIKNKAPKDEPKQIIDPSKRAEIEKRINQLERIYKRDHDAEVKEEMDELQIELDAINNLEMKNVAMVERIAIMESDMVPQEKIKDHLITQVFQTEMSNVEYIPAQEYYKKCGMRLDPEHGLLVGLEAMYGVEGCRNPWRQNA